MASITPVTAANRTVPGVLALLDSSFSDFASGVAEAKYAFWIGSGISRDRLPDLGSIVERVMTYFYDQADFKNSTCIFQSAMRQSVDLASLSQADLDSIDYTKHFSIWPQRKTIINNLIKVYSQLLDIRLLGRQEDFLIWEVVDVRKTYGDDAIDPDSEHLAIAILVLEGVLSELVSTNWDGLIEKALQELSPFMKTATVCVLDVDLRDAVTAHARLYKFHGCAVLAKADEATYRSRLIARKSQISGWMEEPKNAAMKTSLTSIAATRPTFMVGMSAQDDDIQYIFSASRPLIPWTWPSKPPSHVFSGEALGVMQDNILKFVYGSAYQENQTEIKQTTLLPAYAKASLIGLVLIVIEQKLRTLSSLIESPVTAAHFFGSGIKHLRDKLANKVGSSHLVFIRGFVEHTRTLLRMFRNGIVPDYSDRSYQALTSEPVSKTITNANFATSGLPELACAIELLGVGDKNSHWTIDVAESIDGSSGAIRLINPLREIAVYFVANEASALRLETSGTVPADRTDALLIFSAAGAAPQTRSPRSKRRTGKRTQRRMINMGTLLAEASDINELQATFREKALF